MSEQEEERYKEIAFPVTKITKTGGCLAIFLKKDICEKEGLKPGDKIIPTLLKRVFKAPDEMTEREEQEYDQKLKDEVAKHKEQEKLKNGYRKLIGTEEKSV